MFDEDNDDIIGVVKEEHDLTVFCGPNLKEIDPNYKIHTHY